MSIEKIIKALEAEVASIDRSLKSPYEPTPHYLKLESRKEAFEDALRIVRDNIYLTRMGKFAFNRSRSK